jgi:excisionase family DNA binding protein
LPTATRDPLIAEETAAAAEAAQALTGVLERDRAADPHRERLGLIAIAATDAPAQQIVVPVAAFELLVDILREMADGNGVTVMPVGAELTTQQAANVLNVSRPYVVKLIDQDLLPARTVGNRRKVRLADLLAFKERDDASRRAAVEALADSAQELDIY